jgi:DNA replication and repair protein RecF
VNVAWLVLGGFRSYASLEWSPEPGVNLLVGANGAGKTNLLEAIAYLSTLKSFRGTPDQALVSDGADSAIIRAGISSDERSRLVEMEIPRRGPKRVQVDKTRLGRSTDLLGVLRVVAFLPEDLDMVKRGPGERRDLLDAVAVQLWPAADLDQREYERAVRQRNAFLRAGDRDDLTLGVWDSRLSQAGGKVLARRARVIESLAPLLSTSYHQISRSDLPVGITYEPSWSSGGFEPRSAAEFSSSLDEALEASRRVDYERRVTTVGPHRDEPAFALGGVDARTHASQGEQRSIALAVKLASHQAVAETVGENPVLLLDDVFSELDPDRSQALARNLPSSTQTMITSARPEDLPVEGRNWKVAEGMVS